MDTMAISGVVSIKGQNMGPTIWALPESLCNEDACPFGLREILTLDSPK